MPLSNAGAVNRRRNNKDRIRFRGPTTIYDVLLRNRTIREYLSLFSHTKYEKAVKYALIYGINTLKAQYRLETLSLNQLEDIIVKGGSVLTVESSIPEIEQRVDRLKQELSSLRSSVSAQPKVPPRYSDEAPYTPPTTVKEEDPELARLKESHKDLERQLAELRNQVIHYPPAAARAATNIPSSFEPAPRAQYDAPATAPEQKNTYAIPEETDEPFYHDYYDEVAVAPLPPSKAKQDRDWFKLFKKREEEYINSKLYNQPVVKKPSSKWRTGNNLKASNVINGGGYDDNRYNTEPLSDDSLSRKKPEPRLCYSIPKPTEEELHPVFEDDLVTTDYLHVKSSGYGGESTSKSLRKKVKEKAKMKEQAQLKQPPFSVNTAPGRVRSSLKKKEKPVPRYLKKVKSNIGTLIRRDKASHFSRKKNQEKATEEMLRRNNALPPKPREDRERDGDFVVKHRSEHGDRLKKAKEVSAITDAFLGSALYGQFGDKTGLPVEAKDSKKDRDFHNRESHLRSDEEEEHGGHDEVRLPTSVVDRLKMELGITSGAPVPVGDSENRPRRANVEEEKENSASVLAKAEKSLHTLEAERELGVASSKTQEESLFEWYQNYKHEQERTEETKTATSTSKKGTWLGDFGAEHTWEVPLDVRSKQLSQPLEKKVDIEDDMWAYTRSDPYLSWKDKPDQ